MYHSVLIIIDITFGHADRKRRSIEKGTVQYLDMTWGNHIEYSTESIVIQNDKHHLAFAEHA